MENGTGMEGAKNVSRKNVTNVLFTASVFLVALGGTYCSEWRIEGRRCKRNHEATFLSFDRSFVRMFDLVDMSGVVFV